MGNRKKLCFVSKNGMLYELMETLNFLQELCKGKDAHFWKSNRKSIALYSKA